MARNSIEAIHSATSARGSPQAMASKSTRVAQSARASICSARQAPCLVVPPALSRGIGLGIERECGLAPRRAGAHLEDAALAGHVFDGLEHRGPSPRPGAEASFELAGDPLRIGGPGEVRELSVVG